MQTLQRTEVEARIVQVLDDVEQGESVLITRNGKPVARISPQAEVDRERVQQAIESILAIRQRTKPVSLEEIFSARDEGRM